jgi:exodeoxyribonuclease VII small subunit
MLTYETAMERLEALAREMENGDIVIDELATKLNEAQQLLAFCKDKLTKAEDEVKRLLEDDERNDEG